MNKAQAIAKLDNVISKSRVEMYKPIQVAEVLHAARIDKSIQLDQLETYRLQSKQLRDAVTRELIGKVSTSSAKFQDDVWNDTAVPPEAMKILGDLNVKNGAVEEYIYQNVWLKNSFLILIRDHLDTIKNIGDINSLFAAFNEDGMRSSGDRLFEIFVVAVLQADISSLNVKIKFEEKKPMTGDSSAERIVQAIQGLTHTLHFSRIGHTNAADAGLDIWSNFGAIVSVKNYKLDEHLALKVLGDTPIGQLVIACDSYSIEALEVLKKESTNRSITLVTKDELIQDAERLLDNQSSAEEFLKVFLSNFDHEFPRNTTLEVFMQSRGYKIEKPTHGRWAK
jgi:type II restriction enzyme